MSQIVLLHSSAAQLSPVIQGKVCAETIENVYPYLRHKFFVYELNLSANFSDIILFLQNEVENNCAIGLLTMEMTHDSKEIERFNTYMEKTIKVDIANKNDGYYRFKYALEKRCFQNNAEFLFVDDQY